MHSFKPNYIPVSSRTRYWRGGILTLRMNQLWRVPETMSKFLDIFPAFQTAIKAQVVVRSLPAFRLGSG
jgi:hypothetical protein